MTFHELIIQSIDSEITQYELEKEQCLKPIYSDKHRRIIKKAKGIAESNVTVHQKRMKRIQALYSSRCTHLYSSYGNDHFFNC